jgi:RHS repeat-associated protein
LHDTRFPGQWFQLESGLHYNWHRHYDPTLGRYTQPDPLGFVDGPSVYAYAGGQPTKHVDVEGLYRMCHRPLNSRVLSGYRHCYLSFYQGSTLGFYDDDTVRPDPLPNHPDTQCTPEQDTDKDECLKKAMQRCINYNWETNNCCTCIRGALAACKTRAPPQSFPNNWPANG